MKQLFWWAIAIATGVYIAGPIVDPDLWWHIVAGRWIVAHGAVPDVDHWNFFTAGTPWRAYSWSIEVPLALLDRLGDQALFAGKMGIAVLLAASLMFTLGRVSGSFFMGGFLGVFATLASFNHFTLRPQSVVWIYLTWLLYHCVLLEREDGATSSQSRKRLAWIAICMCLWANAQITQPIGILCISAWLWDFKRKSIAAKAVVAGFLGTLLTPYLGTEWLTFFAKTGHPISFRSIAEFSPATILQYSTGFLILISSILAAFLIEKPSRITATQGLLGLTLLGGALGVLKFIPIAVIVCCFLIARVWWQANKEQQTLGHLQEAFLRLESLFLKLPKEGAAFLCLCTAVVNGHSVWQQPVSHKVVPVEELDFIQSNSLPHPISHGFGQGGYVMYRFSDVDGNLEHKVVIDGRTNMVPPKVWDAFSAALNGKLSWGSYIELTNPKTILWHNASALSALLTLHPDWCLVYRKGDLGAGFSIFVHREALGSFSGPVANCTGFPALSDLAPEALLSIERRQVADGSS
jgi:hypothetical protein